MERWSVERRQHLVWSPGFSRRALRLSLGLRNLLNHSHNERVAG
jgi:hypothetical protein